MDEYLRYSSNAFLSLFISAIIPFGSFSHIIDMEEQKKWEKYCYENCMPTSAVWMHRPSLIYDLLTANEEFIFITKRFVESPGFMCAASSARPNW